MKIKNVIFSKGYTGFFFDDQKAIKAGAKHDGFDYVGKPQTPGFKRIRVAGESVSIILVLDNGQYASGDACAVQYSGAGGRDPLFLADNYISLMEKQLKPKLIGRKLDNFSEIAAEFDALTFKGKPMHMAIRYGLSQALLNGVALAKNKLPAEVILEEYKLPTKLKRVPIFGQSGDDRYNNSDKMILKGIDVLPHALINSVPEKLGLKGEKLEAYVKWLAKRVKALRSDKKYVPDLHIDVYGTIGLIFNNEPKKIVKYLKKLEKAAGEHQLYIEGPVDMGEKQKQIEVLKAITDELKKEKCSVKIVADEWCNTYEDIVDFTDAKCCHMVQIKTPDLGSIHNVVESVLYCQQHGMEAYQGGTCNETDVSARTCVHLAVATQAKRMLAKPGMGLDEGFHIVNNEMGRILAILKSKSKK